LSPQPTLARPGRPKDSAKRAAILAAAADLFAQEAFETVTMEAVAAQAGVSKMTVYSHFTDKETLFETIVTSVSDEMIRAFPPPEHGTEQLDERLTRIGTTFLTILLGPKVASMSHTLPALRANKALAQRFYNAGPGRMKAALSKILAEAAANGALQIDSAEWAAGDLLSLWEGGLQGLCAFGLAAPATAEEIAQRARRGTRVFLRAYAARPTPSYFT
jgi:TetR/AcrR family transcriptional repressor of mexJK operon